MTNDMYFRRLTYLRLVSFLGGLLLLRLVSLLFLRLGGLFLLWLVSLLLLWLGGLLGCSLLLGGL